MKKINRVLLVPLIVTITVILLYILKITLGDKKQPEFPSQEYIGSYFGGSANESCWGIALDDDGNVYVTGYTLSPDFPIKPGSYVSPGKGKGEVFVLKFDRRLKRILASALIGGSENEVAYSIVLDKRGYVYIAGYTDSSDFPVTPRAYSTKYNGGEGDGFILKLDKNLKSVIASTFVGGSGKESDWYSAEMVLDKHGNVYMAGNTSSIDFPTTQGAYGTKYHGGDKDIFIAKLDARLENLLASTLYGGSANDQIGRGLTIDPGNGEICIAGITFSADFPTSPDAYSRTVSGGLDGYIAKFTPDLSQLTRSTILPSGWIYSMFICNNGDIYVGGHTGIGLPTTPKAFYQKFDKHIDQGFISRFSNDLTVLKSSTILPGTPTTRGGGQICSLNLGQSRQGDIISTGWVRNKDFPSTPNAFDETQNGGGDTYILKMDPDLSTVLAATFIGGSRSERWNRMAQDGRGRIYIGSYTLSPDFPTTRGAAFETFQSKITDEKENLRSSPTDAFLITIDETLRAEKFEKFHDAAKKDQIRKMEELLTADKSNLEKRDKYQRTPLHSAARYGSISALQYLIEKGADLNAKDESGNTPLHLATLHSHDKAAEILVGAKADLNALNNDGESPLSVAVFYGTRKTLGLLLSSKADNTFRDKDNNTLLHIAAGRGNLEKVQEILHYGPDLETKNGAGDTPLLSAVKKYKNEAVVSHLLDNGANIKAVDDSGKSILHIANFSNIRILIQKGAEVNIRDRDGNTPLHKITMDLLRYKRFYPFMKETTKLLLAAKANPNIKNKQGKSPLDLAAESGIREAIDTLKNKKN